MPVPYSPKRKGNQSLFGGMASELPDFRRESAPPPPPPLPPPGPEDAVVVEISKTKSILDLEKHLDDFKKGQAYLSHKTSSKIKSEHYENVETLPPNDLFLYEAYRTGLNYEANAYLTRAVNEVSETVKTLSEASEKAEKRTSRIRDLSDR